MGLLDTILSTIDAKKRSAKRGIMDMLDNPQQWAGMQANRIQEDRYGGAENAQAMKQYLTKQPYDKKALTAANDALRNAAINESLGAVTAWHGSPHKFDKFDMSKIGTGEGAQAYGHGLYVAETPEVAKQYAEGLSNGKAKNSLLYRISGSPRDEWGVQLSKATDDYNAGTPFLDFNQIGGDFKTRRDAIKAFETDSGLNGSQYKIKREKIGEGDFSVLNITPKSQLYKVDIPDEAVARFLDWDKPLSEQAPEVQKAITNAYPHLSEQSWYQGTKRITDPELLSRIESELKNRPSEVEAQGFYKASPLNESWTGQDLLNHLGRKAIGASGDAEKTLNSVGIPGIRYLDGGSRSAGQGSSNYVLFDDQLPRILERNGQPTGLQPWAKGEWKGLLDEPAPKLTEFEQRHLAAQKNAALPVEQGGLGLPPNNTAMDRAAILFPESGFHATGADIKSIDKSKVAESDYGTIGQGFYIDPREGAGYSNLIAKINSNKEPQNIMPLRYNADNLYDVTDLVGVKDAASSAKLTSNLKDAGYSGTVSMTMDGLPNEVAIFDPSKVRSRFAAFDPKRRHEADLLGYADPYLLGAMGAGGLLGMGGYSMMNDK